MTDGRDVVFLGPTLTHADARAIHPDAVYLPPVAQSDILSLIWKGELPAAIGIVDGVFFMTPPVWHKEILLALERGIPVYGASSMGALRAAECDRYGMVGVGEVYRRYRDGELTDDDEVAISHADEELGWLAMSEPLVNVRATLEAAVDEGRLSADDASAVVAAAKELWFPERRRDAIVALARECGRPADAVEDAFENHYVDIKRLDAIALLERMRNPEPSDRPEPFTMERSFVYLMFEERDPKVEHEGSPVRLDEIKRHAVVEHPDAPALLERAVDRMLIDRLAAQWKVEATAAEVASEVERLRWRLRIGDGDEALAEWCEANDLTADRFDALMTKQARARRLRRWLRVREDRRALATPVLDELRLRGEYPEWAARAGAARAAGASAADAAPRAVGELIREHMVATGWRPDPPLDQFADEAGFSNVNDLILELLQSDRTRRGRRETAAAVAALFDATE